jgi:hypothetical protein
MTSLTEILVRDLQEVAGFLTEPGMVSAQTGTLQHAPLVTISGTIRAAETLTGWSRQLLVEIAEEDRGNDRLEMTNRPVGAMVPKNPGAWDLSGDIPIPTHWLRYSPKHTLNTMPLHWLKYVIQDTEDRLEKMTRRVVRHRESLEFLRTSSHWVERDIEQSETIAGRLNGSLEMLRVFKRTIDIQCGKAITPRRALPRPFPSGRTWQSLRRLAQHWLEPNSGSASLLSHALSEAATLAETPFLYQRWATFKVVQEFERLGFRPQNREDALWTVFLGGQISLGAIDIFVEPHLGRHTHPSGLLADTDQSPDIIINIQTKHGIESILLDPTLSQDSDHLRAKGKYVQSLRRAETRRIAGVAVIKRPRRSWAISPTHESSCRLLGMDEKCGVIPMNPTNYQPSALNAFLTDILEWI